MRRLVLALGLVAAASVAQAAGECSLSSISICQNGNQLLWAKDFKTALKGFAGKQKVAWFGAKAPLWETIVEAMSGAPEDRAELAPGVYRFSASRYQSAMERGAVVVDQGGKIRAAGVLHFNCTKKRCDTSYTLTVILKQKDDVASGWIEAWGKEQMAANAANGAESVIARTDRLTTGK